jgi:hypothetical protein
MFGANTMLTKEQIKKLTSNPKIQKTIKANKEAIAKRRECDLMLLGYNQALLDTGQHPEGHDYNSWSEVIKGQRDKLGV